MVLELGRRFPRPPRNRCLGRQALWCLIRVACALDAQSDQLRWDWLLRSADVGSRLVFLGRGCILFKCTAVAPNRARRRITSLQVSDKANVFVRYSTDYEASRSREVSLAWMATFHSLWTIEWRSQDVDGSLTRISGDVAGCAGTA